MDHKKIAFYYIGDGSGYYGIPARDLTKAEYEALQNVQKEMVKESQLYKAAGKIKSKRQQEDS